ncbi:MAG: hypothetical protein AAF525_15930 [Pseudomonadota bacterium]
MRTALVMMLVFVASGCAWFKPDPMHRLAGQWQSEVGGYPVVLSYTETSVQVNGEAPTDYSKDGNTIKIVSADGEHEQTREITFQGRNTMVMTDPLTGTERTYLRVVD